MKEDPNNPLELHQILVKALLRVVLGELLDVPGMLLEVLDLSWRPWNCPRMVRMLEPYHPVIILEVSQACLYSSFEAPLELVWNLGGATPALIKVDYLKRLVSGLLNIV